jgi:protein-S-isoprenylcysteine O-methyltransferase Ste14
LDAWKQLRAIVLIPVVVMLVIPAVILLVAGREQLGVLLPTSWGLPIVVVGTALLFSGFLLVVRTNQLFFEIGQGTLAPWDPTRKLVVHGVYRHVRNPMIVGVSCILLGETVLFGSFGLLAWFAVFVTVNLIYIPLREEPGLVKRFGDDYLLYKRNVPRWIPRLTPWKGLG